MLSASDIAARRTVRNPNATQHRKAKRDKEAYINRLFNTGKTHYANNDLLDAVDCYHNALTELHKFDLELKIFKRLFITISITASETNTKIAQQYYQANNKESLNYYFIAATQLAKIPAADFNATLKSKFRIILNEYEMTLVKHLAEALSTENFASLNDLLQSSLAKINVLRNYYADLESHYLLKNITLFKLNYAQRLFARGQFKESLHVYEAEMARIKILIDKYKLETDEADFLKLAYEHHITRYAQSEQEFNSGNFYDVFNISYAALRDTISYANKPKFFRVSKEHCNLLDKAIMTQKYYFNVMQINIIVISFRKLLEECQVNELRHDLVRLLIKSLYLHGMTLHLQGKFEESLTMLSQAYNCFTNLNDVVTQADMSSYAEVNRELANLCMSWHVAARQTDSNQMFIYLNWAVEHLKKIPADYSTPTDFERINGILRCNAGELYQKGLTEALTKNPNKAIRWISSAIESLSANITNLSPTDLTLLSSMAKTLNINIQVYRLLSESKNNPDNWKSAALNGLINVFASYVKNEYQHDEIYKTMTNVFASTTKTKYLTAIDYYNIAVDMMAKLAMGLPALFTSIQTVLILRKIACVMLEASVSETNPEIKIQHLSLTLNTLKNIHAKTEEEIILMREVKHALTDFLVTYDATLDDAISAAVECFHAGKLGLFAQTIPFQTLAKLEMLKKDKSLKQLESTLQFLQSNKETIPHITSQYFIKITNIIQKLLLIHGSNMPVIASNQEATLILFRPN